MIAIVDCAATEPHGLRRVLQDLGADVNVTASVEALDRAQKLIIPTGKSFAGTVRILRDRQLVQPLLRAVRERRPILGISLGLHVLLDVSYEAGQHTGLGVVHGKVSEFDFGPHPAARHFTLPHQGWNQVHWMSDCPLMAGLQSGDHFYFDHSLHAEPLDHRAISAQSNHGIDFTAAIWQDHVYATQFLPERSEDAGKKLLANFLAL